MRRLQGELHPEEHSAGPLQLCGPPQERQEEGRRQQRAQRDQHQRRERARQVYELRQRRPVSQEGGERAGPGGDSECVAAGDDRPASDAQPHVEGSDATGDEPHEPDGHDGRCAAVWPAWHGPAPAVPTVCHGPADVGQWTPDARPRHVVVSAGGAQPRHEAGAGQEAPLPLAQPGAATGRRRSSAHDPGVYVRRAEARQDQDHRGSAKGSQVLL